LSSATPKGKLGLLGRKLPAPRRLVCFFGRNEESGLPLRVYHGWKFETSGQLRGYAERAGREVASRRKVRAVGLSGRGGAAGSCMPTWALEKSANRASPHFEWSMLPEQNVHHEYKAVYDCSWMQGAGGRPSIPPMCFFLHSRLDPEAGRTVGAYHPDRSPQGSRSWKPSTA